MSKIYGKPLAAAIAAAAAAGGLVLSASAAAWAQRPPQVQIDQQGRPINAATDVNWDQKLDSQVSLDTAFVDEKGRSVTLGEYFKKKPVVVVMPFYECPGICAAELNGLVDTFQDLQYRVGRDFHAVVVSINPKETPELAASRKKEYLALLEQPGAEKGWHFLTGQEQSIKKLAKEIGYSYRYDAKTDQYAHPGGIVLLTPDGKVSRYFFGVAFPAKDVRLGLTEAGKGHIGSPVEKILLYCYHYDPMTGKYGFAIFRVLQLACLATLLTVGSFMMINFNNDRRAKQQQQQRISAGPGSEPSTDKGAEA